MSKLTPLEQDLLGFARRVVRQLPNIADPDAVAEDLCVEVEITWRDWALLRRVIAAVDGRPA